MDERSDQGAVAIWVEKLKTEKLKRHMTFYSHLKPFASNATIPAMALSIQ
jgi:hypothetical protein